MNETLDKIGSIGVIPVIKLSNPNLALGLGKALLKGTLPVAEVTFRTDAAEESIRILSKELPDLLVGAGTVTTIEQVKKAKAAGASFIVTPGLNPKVVAFCQEVGLPVIPGVNTPSHVEDALEMGLEVLKFFPAEASGGVKTLKALDGPYGGKVSFIPTGGVDTKNLAEYLTCPNVFAIGGSWMVPNKSIDSGDFETVERLCHEARMFSLGFDLLHIGINGNNVEDSLANAKFLSEMFYMHVKEGNSSIFVGTKFEIMKSKGRGTNGHIALSTLSLERALAWLSTFNIHPIKETIKQEKDKITFAYLDKEIMGFSFHLNKKII